MLRQRSIPAAAVAAILLLAGAGCTATRAYREAQREEARDHWDLAVLGYDKAHRSDPENNRFKLALARAKIKAAQAHFNRGRLHRSAGQLDLAAVEFEQAVALDPTHDVAQQEWKRTLADMEARRVENQGGTPVERAKARTRGARAVPPMLNPASSKAITVSFAQETPVKKIYQYLASAAGINIIYDPQLKDDKYTIDIRDMPFQRALETVMRQAGHFYKVIDDKTILIAQDTNQNRKEYEDLVIRTFFLSNGDVKDVSAMVRNILDLRRIAAVPQLNAIVIRDTADKVAVAERIIEENDKAKAEVVVDVELLQLNTQKLVEIGTQLSSYSTTGVLSSAAGSSGSTSGTTALLPWKDLFKLGISDFSFSVPQITFNFIKTNTDAELLAKPQLRIAEGEKAQLTIGDRVPIPVTTVNTAQAIGGTGVVPITSFQYQDVGIKIDLEPRVHHNKEVTLKLTIEVSNLNGNVAGPNGQQQPIIGTRTLTSTIRLKDGETNFLAGLIRTDEQKTKTSLPVLGDLPIIGALFSDNSASHKRTDLFLTLTPHIIRAPQITEEDLLPIWVGTENNVSFSGTATRLESPNAPGSPFEGNPGFAQPGGATGLQSGAPPTNVIQGSGPNDPFRRDFPKPAPVNPAPSNPAPIKPHARVQEPDGTASDAVRLALNASAPELRAGEGGMVWLQGSDGLSRTGALELTVEWDPAVLEVTGVRPGPWQDEASTVRFEANKSAGRATLQFGQRSGASGLPSGMLAQLAVRGVAPGDALVRVSAGAAAGPSGTLRPVVEPVAITVRP